VGIDWKLFSSVINWDIISNAVKIDFTKDLKISQFYYGPSASLLSLSKMGNQPLPMTFGYNLARKEFLIDFRNIKLERDVFKIDAGLASNVNASSVHDLVNSSVSLLQFFPDTFQSVSIFNLNITSKDFNLNFRELENTLNKAVFICSHKLGL
jgi:hypothetical protein